MDDDFSAWAADAERPLLRSTYLLTGDLHRSEDLVQEAMVKVALRWGRLRDGHPTAYARRVYLAAWNARTGDFERLATGPEEMGGVRVALGVLAAP